MSENLTLRLTEEYTVSAQKVFDAIADGRLFKYTGAKMEHTKLDFRAGGAYALVWSDTDKGQGTFTTIDPPKTVAFTWATPGASGPMETRVTISIEPKGTGSVVTLVHEGFPNQATHDDCVGGWTDALQDLKRNV